MSWRPAHEWKEGARLPDRAAGVVIIAARLSTCSHCQTLRVVDEGSGDVTYIRRAAREEDRVSSKLPSCLSPSPFFRHPEEAPALSEPVRAVLAMATAPAQPVPVEPPPVVQLGLW